MFPSPRFLRTATGTLVVAAVAAVAGMVPSTALATVTISRAELNSGSVRIEGRALANRPITVDAVAMATSDRSGNFRVSRSPFAAPADCTVDVNDGSATPTVARLSGCTVTTAPPPPPSSSTILPDVAEIGPGFIGEDFTDTTGNIISFGGNAVGPVRWEITAGALPAGLAVVVPEPGGRPRPASEETFMSIDGTPTTVQTSTFTLRATDANGLTATRAYTIRINPARALAITPQSWPPLRVGESANLFFDGSGGVQPYRWAVTAGALPPGMTLVDDTPGDRLVRVGGTPSASGTFTWAFRLTDAHGTTLDRAFSVTVGPASVLTGLAITPVRVTAGSTATGTVTLDAPAPAAGAEVLLTTSDPAIASVPVRVYVLAAATTADFPIWTAGVGSATTVTVTASYAGGTRSAALTVDPASADSVAVSAVSLAPSAVTGGNTCTGTVTLTGPAPAGGATVTLASSGTVAAVPANVTVPAGSSSATFLVTTGVVTTSGSVTISASFGGTTATAELTVSPASTEPTTLATPSPLSPANDARWAPNVSRTFDWSDVSRAAGYTLQVSTSSAFTSIQLERVVTASQLALSFAGEGTRYWRVRANDGAGNPGPWSSARFFRIKA